MLAARRVRGTAVALRALAVVASATLAGCATLTRGLTQDVQIATDPAGAACELRRGDVLVDSVATTPGYVRVRKGLGRYALVCRREPRASARNTTMKKATEPSTSSSSSPTSSQITSSTTGITAAKNSQAYSRLWRR